MIIISFTMKRKTRQVQKKIVDLSKLFKKLEVYSTADLKTEFSQIIISCSYQKKRETGSLS